MHHTFNETTNTFTLYGINPNIHWDPFDDTYCCFALNNIKIIKYCLYKDGVKLTDIWSSTVDKLEWVFENRPNRKDFQMFVKELYEVMYRMNLNVE
jgi:hypothetical protein